MKQTQLHIKTPVFASQPLGAMTGKSVFLKMECFQPAGSFKIRGIGLLCKECVDGGTSHLVCSSGGNAGFAVAYAGRQLGVQVTVVVPETTSGEVRCKIEEEGAEVIVRGAAWDETHAFASALSKKVRGACISPFDHPTIWRGHATLVDEIVDQVEKPDALVLSVGGGGLLCGVLQGLERHGWGDIAIVAAETEGTCSLAASMAAGQLVALDHIRGVATTLGAKQVAARAFEYAQTHRITPFVTTDEAAIDACLQFCDHHRIIVEPACGASLAAVYQRAEAIRDARSVLVIVCGGIGAGLDKLLEWKK